MRTKVLVMAIAVLCVACGVRVGQAEQDLPLKKHPAADTYPGWRLGIQAYSFRAFTFFEAVDKTASLGLDWIEAYPGQKVGGPFPEVTLTPDISQEVRKAIKKKLDRADIRLVNYGVVGLPDDEDQCRQVFEFADAMGVETIVSEPPMEALDMIEELCREYGIQVAIHNHPKPSSYWNPEKVLEASEGRGKWIGACADPGHWERSGLDPVESLRKLEGHIVTLHLKDVKEGDDIIWGTGGEEGNDMAAILEELDRQGFEGVMSIEYESNWQDNVPDIRRCISYYDRHALALGGNGYEPIMDGRRWISPLGVWNYEDGVMSVGHVNHWLGGDIWTVQKYRDFVLDLEFKVDEGTNSGIFLRVPNYRNILSGLEVQILDSHGRDDVGRHDCGAIYDVRAPSENAIRAPGEWNHITITCKDHVMNVVLNGEQIINMDLRRWGEARTNPDGSDNKFSYPLSERIETKGRIGFQYHGHPVWYRNIKIKRLR